MENPSHEIVPQTRWMFLILTSFLGWLIWLVFFATFSGILLAKADLPEFQGQLRLMILKLMAGGLSLLVGNDPSLGLILVIYFLALGVFVMPATADHKPGESTSWLLMRAALTSFFSLIWHLFGMMGFIAHYSPELP